MLRRETNFCTGLVHSAEVNRPHISSILSESKIANCHTRGTWIRAYHPKIARLFYGASRLSMITVEVVSFRIWCHCDMSVMLRMDMRGWNLFCFKVPLMNNSSLGLRMQQVGNCLSTEILMYCILARMLHTVQV